MTTTTPRHTTAKIKYREVWLNEALDQFIRPHFEAAGYTVPEHIRISTGWPSRGGLAKKKKTIGQAWSPDCSGDGVHETIISLYLDDSIKVLGVLIHEVVHHVVGVGAGHRKPFADCAKAVGLVGPWTATGESEELIQTCERWIKKLGPYPHAKLDGSDEPKQSTRLLKIECESCGCKVRLSAKWLDLYGEFPCPCGGTLAEEL